MDIVPYIFNKFNEPDQDEPIWKHIFSLAYGSQLHVTRISVASHILIVYTIIGMFLTDGSMIINYGQLILACMLMVELRIFANAINAIEDFKKL